MALEGVREDVERRCSEVGVEDPHALEAQSQRPHPVVMLARVTFQL